MADHPPIQFPNQRYRERTGGAKRFDDEMFGVLADSWGLEGGAHVSIAARFELTEYFAVHWGVTAISMRNYSKGHTARWLRILCLQVR